MNRNIYHYSEQAIQDLRDGRTPLGSIVEIQWPSGNGAQVRFHGWNYENDVMVGCSMGWDNGATQWFDLRRAVVKDVELPKEKICAACNKLVYMWHKHSMWCTAENPFPLVSRREKVAA